MLVFEKMPLLTGVHLTGVERVALSRNALRHLTQLTSLRLDKSGVEDEDLQCFSCLKGLQEISFLNCRCGWLPFAAVKSLGCGHCFRRVMNSTCILLSCKQ